MVSGPVRMQALRLQKRAETRATSAGLTATIHPQAGYSLFSQSGEPQAKQVILEPCCVNYPRSTD